MPFHALKVTPLNNSSASSVSSVVPTPRSGAGTYVNPVLGAGTDVDFGDPFVLEYLGEYFLYHSGPHGVAAYRSRDLVAWEPAGTVLRGAGEGHWAQVELWAPEVVHRRGEFVMYVAATRFGEGPRMTAGKANGADGGDDIARRQGVARSRDPLGPFVWDDEPIVKEWAIDGHPYLDDDGSEWLFYNVRNEATRFSDGTVGCGNVVDRVLPDGTLAGYPVEVAYPTERWEANEAATQYWNEAPFTLKRRGRYYQMYSGGFFGGDGYALGLSVSDSLMGPWSKLSTTPMFISGGDVSGPGHHCVTRGPDGVSQYAVYHGYVGTGFGRKVHIDPLYWSGDGPQLGAGRRRPTSPSAESRRRPSAPVYDPAVATFAIRAWVRGGPAVVSGVPVEIDDETPCLIESVFDGRRLTVRRDSAVVWRGAASSAEPVISGTQILHIALTSHLDDDREHVLEPGSHLTWAWGGRTAVECRVAVKGEARISFGGTVVSVHTEGWELVTIAAPSGGDGFTVFSASGARVADVVLTARDA